MSDSSQSLGLVLVSGGMDSLTVTAMASKLHSQLALIHLNYGQKTEEKELDCFKKIARYYNVAPELVKIVNTSFLKEIGGSSLTDKKISVKSYSGDSEEIPDSYVPFRNTIILSLAVSWAETIGADKVYIGAVHEDSSGYPDCRPEYYKAFNHLITQGTKKGNIEIVTPIIHMTKDQIVKKAMELKAPLEYSWSCYAENVVACGVCDSCALRLRAFERLGIEDPIEYKVRPKYLK